MAGTVIADNLQLWSRDDGSGLWDIHAICGNLVACATEDELISLAHWILQELGSVVHQMPLGFRRVVQERDLWYIEEVYALSGGGKFWYRYPQSMLESTARDVVRKTNGLWTDKA